jgi:hypothetical protein
MKCRHYRPEPAFKPPFSCRGHSPASAWRYRILLTDELTGLFGLAHSSGSLSEWRLDPRTREAISRRSSSISPRAYAAGGGARAPQGTHTLPSVTVTVVSLVCGDQHSQNPLLIPERARARWLRPDRRRYHPVAKAAYDESSSAPGSPAPRMSEYASLELGKRTSNPKHQPALA